VGPNAAFLNENGKLTDIGSWYLGGPATGVVPDPNAKASQNDGGKVVVGSVWALFVVGVCFCVL
jgi:hypothetical protein